MKKLLDMPMTELLGHLVRLKATQPISVHDCLRYTMFMGAIERDLEQSQGDIMSLTMERIQEHSVEFGGFVEQKWQDLTGKAMVDAMLYNSEQGTFFMRLAHFTAAYLK